MDDWPERFAAEAARKVGAFLAAHPQYTQQGVPEPGQGSTNRVSLARRGEDLVVFKVFCERQRRDRECFALRHWRDTGLVPALLWDDDPVMIVTSYVPGQWLHVARQIEGEELWRRSCHQTGAALGRLSRVPMSAAERIGFESRFYQDLPTLELYLGRILGLGRLIAGRDPDFADAFWRQNLDFIESQLGLICAQERVLYHQDANNLHVSGGRFMGFFDLEMCRVGCAAMQLGSALDMGEGRADAWTALREGWESAVGEALSRDDLRASAAARYLLLWREISRYMSYDGTPGTGFAWAEPADPGRYRDAMVTTARMLGID